MKPATLLLLLAGCGAPPDAKTELGRRLRADLIAVCAPYTNAGREEAVRSILRRDGVPFAEHKPVLWSLRRNLLANFAVRHPPKVLFLAHVDMTDALTALPRGWSLGAIDGPALSGGALDNGGGVAVGIELARRGYPVAFTALEEAGLLGSRALAAEMDVLPELVISIDCVGDGQLLVVVGATPNPIAASDQDAFNRQNPAVEIVRGVLWNGPLGVLPWHRGFFRATSTEAVLLTSERTWPDVLACAMALPCARIHGPRDRLAVIEIERLEEAVAWCVARGQAIHEGGR